MMDFLPSIVSELHNRDGILLGSDYIVTDDDVLCGRGKSCFFHIGNVRYRDIVALYVPAYQNAVTKYQKTCIINEIINIVRSNSPNGGFIRKDLETSNYFEVGDYLAHEKTSQAFRDAISTTTSKVTKKRLKNNHCNTTTTTLNRLVSENSSAINTSCIRMREEQHHLLGGSLTPPPMIPSSPTVSTSATSHSRYTEQSSPFPFMTIDCTNETNWKTTTTSCNNKVPGSIMYSTTTTTTPKSTRPFTNHFSEQTQYDMECQSAQNFEDDFVAFDQWIDENVSNQQNSFGNHVGAETTDVLRRNQVSVNSDNGNTSHQHHYNTYHQQSPIDDAVDPVVACDETHQPLMQTTTFQYEQEDEYTFDLLLQFSDKFQSNKDVFLKY